MVSLDKAVIARLRMRGETFEILVDPDLAYKLKSGEKVDFNELLAIDAVFKDARAGERASTESLLKVFNTDNLEKIAKEIIIKGDVQLTTEQRRKMLAEKRKQIATIIARRAINPQTNTPHPVTRILKAMEEAKVDVKLSKTAEEQVEYVVTKIRTILPIRLEVVKLAVKIPAQYSGKAYSILKEFGEIKREEWDSQGNFLALLEMPAGVQEEFYGKLNSLTRGEVQIKKLEK